VRDLTTNQEGHNPHNPRTDIRETSRRFFIDIEVPGVRSHGTITLTWIHKNCLYLKGNVDRPKITLDDNEISMKINDGDTPYNPGYYDKPVHTPCSERHIGWFARTFTFIVDVNQDSLKSQLVDGMLSMIIEKADHDQNTLKEVQVHNPESQNVDVHAVKV
jgi:HSP20 family molecular chaperone IbpA